jgi:putative DNA primase/helicase
MEETNTGDVALRDAESQEYEFTDAHLAGKLVEERLEGEFLWALGLGWMRWTGKRWERTDQPEPIEAARQWVVSHWEEARRQAYNAAQSKAARIQLLQELRNWEKWTSSGRVRALVEFAKGLLHRSYKDFDAFPDLLNCNNGIVSLRTGDLLPHDPAKMLTKLAPVDYRPDATHADWDAALSALPADIRGWYRARLGQGITGHMTPDDVLLVQQGQGANGKSTIMGAIQATLIDYFLVVSPRALNADASAHTTELASFRGARLASLEELPEERQLSVVRLKTLCGTPVLTARFIAQDDMSFDATHTLVINTNYAPAVTETDDGTWRRLVLVHFPYRYVRHEDELRGEYDRIGDQGLRDRLRRGQAQREAVLAWLVRGAMEWYACDRVMPPLPGRVAADTEAWRETSDLVLAYVKENLRFDPASHVMSTELQRDFNTWLIAQSHRPWNSKTFVSRFSGHQMFRNNAVEKRFTRRMDGLSRRPADLGYPVPPLPNAYTAWFGVAFAEDDFKESPPVLDVLASSADWQSSPPIEPTRSAYTGYTPSLCERCGERHERYGSEGRPCRKLP